jgi:membrane associated rhomboid family serine protease
MFPIRDHNPSQTTPWVVRGIIVLNILIYLLTADWGGGMTGLWQWGALYPGAITQGVYLHGLLTHMFLHAGLLHIAGNMLFLWVFGDNLEDQLGHVGFLLFYLAGGLAAAAGQISADPTSAVPMVGASGAIAAVMGGYLLLFPRARVDILFIIVVVYKIFTVPAFIVLGFWFGLQLLYTFSDAADGVAYSAHAAGFVAGLVMALPWFIRLGGPAFWGATRGRPPHPSIEYKTSRVPVVRRRR